MRDGSRIALPCCVLLATLVSGCELFESGPGSSRPDAGLRGDAGPSADAGPGADAGSSAGFLTAVEDDLLAAINEERSAAGLPRLVRDPGLDRVIQWHVAGMEAEHRLGHDDRNGRRGEGRARYYSGDMTVRCSEIIQWWGSTPSGEVHYRGYFDSPPHHDAYMERGMYNLGPTMHAGVGAIAGTGPTGSMFEGRAGSYTGVLLCDRGLTLTIDPFSEP